VGAVDTRTRRLDALELGGDVGVDRLVEEREGGLEAVFAAIERGREPPVRSEAAEGEDRAAPAPLGIGDQPLELSDLVPAPTARAEGAVFLDPDAETDQLADGRRPLREDEMGKRFGEGRKALM
jgi:hypothetical protein